MVSLVQDGDLVGCAQKARMLRVAPRRPVVGSCSSIGRAADLKSACYRFDSCRFKIELISKAKVCDTRQIKCTYRSCNMEASGTRKESDERVRVVI